MATTAKDVQAKVRENSRAVWNEWVGGWRARELTAFGVAGAFALHGLIADIGWWQAAHQPVLPASIITVDRYGQVLDARKPMQLAQYTDLQLKHAIYAYLQCVFRIYNGAQAMADDYQCARDYMLPGSQAFVDVQLYWDRYSPLRKMPDGTLQMPNPPKDEVEIGVPSFISRGKTTDGADVWDLSWTATATSLDNGTQFEPQRYTARLEFVRSYDGMDDAAKLVNPFGIRVRFFKWDKQE
jgi:type IV secretory pathway TrbF-like protein